MKPDTAMAIGLMLASLVGGALVIANALAKPNSLPAPCFDAAERPWDTYQRLPLMRTASSAQLNPLTAPPRHYSGTWEGSISEVRGVRSVCIPLDADFRVCAIYDMINNDSVRVLGQTRERTGWRTDFVQQLNKETK